MDETVYEFFGPFAHIENRYEWCRIRSPTHGIFNCFIELRHGRTDVPPTVYVDSDIGERFMSDRYPESEVLHCKSPIAMLESLDGRVLDCQMGTAGAIIAASMRFETEETIPRQVPYGGEGRPVWGSKYTCFGVDLNFRARVTGFIERVGEKENFDEVGVLSCGSFGRIDPLTAS